jgi:hypothetical protein
MELNVYRNKSFCMNLDLSFLQELKNNPLWTKKFIAVPEAISKKQKIFFPGIVIDSNIEIQ